MVSLYCSKFDRVLGVFRTLRIRSILQIGDDDNEEDCFRSQLDWNMISTMFLLVSSGPNSDTACLTP